MKIAEIIMAVMLLCPVFSGAAFAVGPLTLIKTIAVDPEGTAGAVDGCEFSKDGVYFAASDNHGVARIFLTADCFGPGEVLPIGKVTHSYHDHTCANSSYELNATVWSHDGVYFATGRNDDGAKVWRTDSFFDPADYATNDTPYQHLVNGTECDGADFSPNNLWLAVAADKNMRVFRTSDFAEIESVSAGDGAVNSIDFSSDSSLVAFGASNGQVKIVTTSNWNIIQSITSTGSVKSVRFSPDDQYLAYSGRDQRCKVYRTSDWSLVVDIVHLGNEQALPCDDQDTNAAVEAVEWSEDGAYFISSGKISGVMHVWDTSTWPSSGSISLDSNDAVQTIQAQEAKRQIEFIDVFENLLIVGGDEGNVRMYKFLPCADINNDNTINYEDLALFGSQWLDTGCGTCGGADFTGEGDVTIDDLAIMAQHWLADCTLMGYWKLDGDSTDSSFNGFDGTLYGNPVWDPNGRVDGALKFDGDGDYVKITGWRGIAGANSRTVCAWIKTDSTTVGEIISWGGDADGERWLLMLKASGELRLAVVSGSVNGTKQINDGFWHHVAAVLPVGALDVSDVKLYVDGIEESTTSTSQAINTAGVYDVKIGVFGSSLRYFNGLIDEVRIYNRALSEDEIENIAGL